MPNDKFKIKITIEQGQPCHFGQGSEMIDQLFFDLACDMLILDEDTVVNPAKASDIWYGVVTTNDSQGFKMLDAVADHLLGELSQDGQVGQVFSGIQTEMKENGAIFGVKQQGNARLFK